MPKEKGSPKTGGRTAGTANKATTEAREAIAAFVEGNVDRLTEWLDRIAQESPDKAFDRFMSVVEYHIPKLARTELANKPGETFKTTPMTKEDEEILNRYIKGSK